MLKPEEVCAKKGLPYRRALLKLSGETLLGDQLGGINPAACLQVAAYITRFHRAGIELGLVIGGGNIFRGMSGSGASMPRTPADHIGMLATLINGIALQQALAALDTPVHLMSALECPKVAESYHWMQARRYLEQGDVVIFVGGTGNPYFTTDTAAALRASEMGVDVLLKATKVAGIYSQHPLKHADAVKYDTVSYAQVLAEKLQIMDATAVALCRSNHIPVFVFHMSRLVEESLEDILTAPGQGTWIRGE